MIHYTAWQGERLERRRAEVIGQSDLAAWASLALVALAIVLMSACAGEAGEMGPAGPQGEPGERGERGADGGVGEPGYVVNVEQRSDAGPDDTIVIPLCQWEDGPKPGECQRLVYGSPGVPGYCNRWVPCD